MVKYSTYTLSKIDPWLERSVTVERRTKRPPEAGHPAPTKLPDPKFQHLRKIPEETTSRRDQEPSTEGWWPGGTFLGRPA